MAEEKQRELTKPRPIYIRWLDSVRHEDGWSTQDEWIETARHDTMLHHSIGFLIHEDENCLVLAHSLSHDTEPYSAVGIMQIPMSAVLKRKWVADPRGFA